MDQRVGQATGAKFSDPDRTADGSPRARVALSDPRTLWFNTGTRCNIACKGCYIDSSPTNDRLAYLTTSEIEAYLDEAEALGWPLDEIGFTGGEPFLNPAIIGMARAALRRGYRVLILTNAMKPMMRKTVRSGLAGLIAGYGDRLTLRVSLDHWTAPGHDRIRGKGAFACTLDGLRWLAGQGAHLAVAGRVLWQDSEVNARAGFAALFAAENLALDAADPAGLVLFPELDGKADVPEITEACWGILGKRPEAVMCASSRMVVKRRGADRPTVLACTLLPYDEGFDLGPTLAEAQREVALNHPHCAKFCVLGGASCAV